MFARDDKGLFLFDYMMRGFVKETLRTFIDLGQCKVSKWSYKRVVDSTLFVFFATMVIPRSRSRS